MLPLPYPRPGPTTAPPSSSAEAGRSGGWRAGNPEAVLDIRHNFDAMAKHRWPAGPDRRNAARPALGEPTPAGTAIRRELDRLCDRRRTRAGGHAPGDAIGRASARRHASATIRVAACPACQATQAPGEIARLRPAGRLPALVRGSTERRPVKRRPTDRTVVRRPPDSHTSSRAVGRSCHLPIEARIAAQLPEERSAFAGGAVPR